MSARVSALHRSVAGGLLLVILLSACATNSDRQRIDVSLSTLGITLSTNTLKAGKTTFVVKNNAVDQTHELLIVQAAQPHEQIPIAAQATSFSEEGWTIMGEMEDIDSGAIKRLTLDLRPGYYLLVCNLPGHYQSGMHAELTVTP